jgi:mRNA guanylyltransferase
VTKIDRHNTYRELTGFYFPHHEFPERPLRSTLVDAELVIDVDPKTQQVSVKNTSADIIVHIGLGKSTHAGI